MCGGSHSYDIARQGYVNLLRRPGRRNSGDDADMVAARGRFLASGAYASISDALNATVLAVLPDRAPRVLDVGCGEGYYARRLSLALGSTRQGWVAGIDVSKPAIAAAAARHRSGWYAVASAFDLPVPDAAIDVLVNVFGPVAEPAAARVLRTGGAVVAVHPGPDHLAAFRSLVYERPEPHRPKSPFRNRREWFDEVHSHRVTFSLVVETLALARDLLAMTPYRWHAPRDIDARLAASCPITTTADVVVTTYRRKLSAVDEARA